MAIFSSLLQVIFPLLHESNTKYSHFSVFPHRWQSLVCVARFCGNYGQHQLSHRYFPAYNKSLAFATAAVGPLRAYSTYTSKCKYLHKFFRLCTLFLLQSCAGSKSNVGKAWRGEELCYRLLNTPLFLLFAFDLLGYYCYSTNCARNTYHTRGIVRKLVFD